MPFRVLQHRDDAHVIVTDRDGKEVARGPEPGQREPTETVTTGPDETLRQMHEVFRCDTGLYNVFVPGSLGASGAVEIGIDEQGVVTIEIGNTVIQVASLIRPDLNRQPDPPTAA